MPINDLGSYIKSCLEEKDYDLYKRIANNENTNVFFDKLEEQYFEDTLKYREGFISDAVETKSKLENIIKQKQSIIENLKTENILIDEPNFDDYDFSQYDLISIELITFSFNNLYEIKFTKEEIECIQNYVEKSKCSNIPVILKSPAEVKYGEISVNLENLKDDLKTYTKEKKFFERLRVPRYNDYLSRKIVELNDQIDCISQIKERKDCFDKITLEQFELIYDYFNIENQYIEILKKWEPMRSAIVTADVFPTMKFKIFSKMLNKMLEENKITDEEMETVKQIIYSDTKTSNRDNAEEKSLYIFPNRLIVINLFSTYLKINALKEKEKVIEKILKRNDK